MAAVRLSHLDTRRGRAYQAYVVKQLLQGCGVRGGDGLLGGRCVVMVEEDIIVRAAIRSDVPVKAPSATSARVSHGVTRIALGHQGGSGGRRDTMSRKMRSGAGEKSLEASHAARRSALKTEIFNFNFRHGAAILEVAVPVKK